ARSRLRERDQLAEILPRRLRLHRQRHRLAGERGDAGEGSVVELHVAGVIRGADAVRVPHQGVAVGRLALDVAVTERATRAGAVHDGDGLPQLLAGQVGELAGEEIGGAAGAEEHRQLDGLRREIGGGHRRGETKNESERSQAPHGWSTTFSGSPMRFSSTSNASWTRLSGNRWVISGLAVSRPAASSASARPTLVPP